MVTCSWNAWATITVMDFVESTCSHHTQSRQDQTRLLNTLHIRVAISKQAHGLPPNITILQVLYFGTVCAHHPLLLQDDLAKNSPNSPVFEECFFWIAIFLPTGCSEYLTKISKDSYSQIWLNLLVDGHEIGYITKLKEKPYLHFSSFGDFFSFCWSGKYDFNTYKVF